MKFGLCLALFVLLASTEVFGQEQFKKTDRKIRPDTDRNLPLEPTENKTSGEKQRLTDLKDRVEPTEINTNEEKQRLTDVKHDEQKPIAIVREETKPLVIHHDANEEVEVVTKLPKSNKVKVVQKTEINFDGATDEHESTTTRPISTLDPSIKPKDIKVPTKKIDEEHEVIELSSTTRDPSLKMKDIKVPTKKIEEEHRETELSSSTRDPSIKPKEIKVPTKKVEEEHEETDWSSTTHAMESEEHRDEHHDEHHDEHDDEHHEKERPKTTKSTTLPSRTVNVVREPGSGSKDLHSDELSADEERITEDVHTEKTPALRLKTEDSSFSMANNVHVSGSIAVTQYRSLTIDSVQYENKVDAVMNNNYDSVKPRLPTIADHIATESRVVLYVATLKTIDPKASFANFSIDSSSERFPLAFNIIVGLPKEQLGLLETADVSLYFYAYITSADGRISTFLPDGTSQILLQGTNRVVQKLQVNVKSNGIEVKGFFRNRYTQQFIKAGTAFQVLIVDEQSLSRLLGESTESVAQLTLNNVPSMYPVPFSLLVSHQELKPKTKYYAIGLIFENGVQRLIKQKPVLVINENRDLVTADVIFTVTPNPLIIRGTVTRTMPGPFYFEPNSSIILSLHEKNSDSPAFTFRLPSISKLPQDILVNVSQAPQFDASLDYEIQAMVTDDKNRIYMTSAQKIPILDQTSKLTIPVDDFFYYVQVRLHSPANEQLKYIPGSKASLIVTENPESAGTPIFDAQFDPTEPDFREFLMKIPIARAQHYRNAYLILLINNSGIITHVSKILLISNNQPPPLRLELPVIPLNLIRGYIHDSEDRPAQWSSSSLATIYLLDDAITSPEKAIVQSWKIHLEREFPVRFDMQVDFSRLLPGHSYSLQSTIESRPDTFEYKPANSISVIRPDEHIQDNILVLVKNVKKTHLVQGLIYITDVAEPLTAGGQILIQLSSSPSLSEPKIVYETRLNVANRRLPLNFTLELPLSEIDISSVYYFLVQYTIGETVIVPVNQVFAFSPRNEATVVLRLTKTRQVRITGQVSSTGGRLSLPAESSLHLYITDSPLSDKPRIYSEVRLQGSTNGQYQFTMYLDAILLQKNVTLFLRADIIYQKVILLSIPRPALLQITPGGEWNINLVIDLPTLLVGEITSLGSQQLINGNFEVFIQVSPRGTDNILSTTRLRLGNTLPQPFRVEIDNSLFVEFPELEVRAVIKNCKEEILFQSGGAVNIQSRLNVNLNLPVVLSDTKKFEEGNYNNVTVTPVQTGQWRLSVTGIVPGSESGVMATLDNGAPLRN